MDNLHNHYTIPGSASSVHFFKISQMARPRADLKEIVENIVIENQ